MTDFINLPDEIFDEIIKKAMSFKFPFCPDTHPRYYYYQPQTYSYPRLFLKILSLICKKTNLKASKLAISYIGDNDIIFGIDDILFTLCNGYSKLVEFICSFPITGIDSDIMDEAIEKKDQISCKALIMSYECIFLSPNNIDQFIQLGFTDILDTLHRRHGNTILSHYNFRIPLKDYYEKMTRKYINIG